MKITDAQGEALEIAYGRKVVVDHGYAKIILTPVGMWDREEGNPENLRGLGCHDPSAVAVLSAHLPTFGSTEEIVVGLAKLSENENEGWIVYANDSGFINFPSLISVESLSAVAGYVLRRLHESHRTRG